MPVIFDYGSLARSGSLPVRNARDLGEEENVTVPRRIDEPFGLDLRSSWEVAQRLQTRIWNCYRWLVRRFGELSAEVKIQFLVLVLWCLVVHAVTSSLPWTQLAPALFGWSGVSLIILVAMRLVATYSLYIEGRNAFSRVLWRSRDIVRLLKAAPQGWQVTSATPDITRQTKSTAAEQDLSDPLERADFMRAVSVDTSASQEKFQRIVGLTLSFSVALKQQLRSEKSLAELRHLSVLDDGLLGQIGHSARKMHLFILDRLSEELMNTPMNARWVMSSMDEKLSGMMEAAGVCERIQAHPLPFLYVLQMRLFATAWLALLPFALAPHLGLGTLPIYVATCFGVYLLESAAVEMECPFGDGSYDLDLDTLCQDLREDLIGALEERRV